MAKLSASKVTLYLNGKPLGEVGSFELKPLQYGRAVRVVPGSVEFQCELVSSGVGRDHKNMADAMDYLTTNHATGRAVTRYSGRGDGLIPSSAFNDRHGRYPIATERGYVPENKARGRTQLAPGGYHKKAVRYDQPREGDDQ